MFRVYAESLKSLFRLDMQLPDNNRVKQCSQAAVWHKYNATVGGESKYIDTEWLLHINAPRLMKMKYRGGLV